MEKIKYILTVIITLCTIITYAQPAQYTPMTAAGYQMKRLKVDSTLHLPSFCGIPTLRGSTAKEGALAIDTCGGFLFIWTNENGWDTIGGSGGGSGVDQDLQSVLNKGSESYNKDINLYGKTSANQIYLSGLDNSNMPYFALGDSIGGGLYQYTYPQATIEFINKFMTQKLKQQDSIRGTIYLPAQISDATDTLAKLSDVRGVAFDSTSLSNRINLKLSISDTASMLSSYSRTNVVNAALANKLNISDTASMLTNYFNKVNYGLSKSGQTIIVDSATLSNKYLRIVDTTNKFVNRLTRTSGKDSIIYFVGGTRYAIKDSVGGGSSQNGRFGNDTATVVMVKVHNDAGVTLTNGKVVALTTSGNNNEAPAVRLANSKGDSTSANTLGFVSGTIANQDTGWVILSGKIEKINTSAYNNGDIIYLDTINGNFTKVKPSAPTHLVYLGVVVKANAGNGAIFVKAQNGYELDEIHDVQINLKLNNQIIVYSDTQKVWKNRSIYSVVDTTTTIATKSNVALKLNAADTTSLSNRIDNKQTNLDILQSLGWGVKAEPYGITFANVTSTLALTSTGMNFYPFNWNVSDTIRGIAFFNRIISLAVTPSNYNGVAIYSLSGTNLVRQTFTANSGTFWDNAVANTWKTQAFTPFFLAKGTYYLGYQASATSGLPTIASGTIMQTGFIEPPVAINANGVKISSVIVNTNTSPPTPIAMSTLTITQRVPYFILY